MEDKIKIPTRAEHDRFIRLLWKWCIAVAFIMFFVTGGIVAALFLSGHDTKKVVEVSTAIFQVLMLSYGLGFFVPMLTTSLLKMSLGVEMSRKGLEIGQETSQTLVKLQNEIKPLVEDAKQIMDELRPMIREFKENDFGKVHKVLDKFAYELNGGGKLDRLVNSVERIAKRTESKADDALGSILEEAWGEDQPKGPAEGTDVDSKNQSG
jgi:hypothetical protein